VKSKLDLVDQQLDYQSQLLKEKIDWEVMKEMLVKVGWTEVTFSTPWSDMTAEFISEIKDWCDKNIVGYYQIRGRTMLFEYQQDAVLFSLRWA